MQTASVEQELVRIRRRSRVALGVVTVALLALGTAVSAYAFPPRPEVSAADVIYVIGPPDPARVEAAVELRRAGVADRILISVYAEGATARNIDLCQEPGVDCLIAEPATTKGEALLLEEYAAANGLDSALVLTVTPHTARTAYVFARCYSGVASVIPVDEELSAQQWAWHFLYQTAAFVKSVLTPC